MGGEGRDKFPYTTTKTYKGCGNLHNLSPTFPCA